MKRKAPKLKPFPLIVEEKIAVKDSEIKWMLLVALMAIISYGLSVANNYALDDFIVFVKNRYVQQGFGGIVNILTKDTFSGMNEVNLLVLKGGRYRPLSLVSFAIENQFLGTHAVISHSINVLLYALIGALLFKFLSNITSCLHIKIGTCLLFITHPLHCESVINVKGRDDLMCLLFFLMTAIYLFHYLKTNKYMDLLISIILFFLCTLSKETSIVFVAIFPLLMYFFTPISLKKNAITSSFYVVIAILFLLIRMMVTRDNPIINTEDVLNNPYVNATFEQHYATVIFTWLLYFKLLLLPIHFSYDYNFNQVPLVAFKEGMVVFSFVIHIVLLAIAAIYLKRKSIYSFAILFYFITFSIVSNLFVNTGTPVAERFMFIPSLGFCIALACILFWIKEKINSNILFYSIICGFTLLYCTRNMARCADWRNNNTLFIADAETAPQSTKVQLNAGIAYLELSQIASVNERKNYIKSAMIHLQKGIAISPNYMDGYLNMGVCYNWLTNFDSAEVWWNKARLINPKHNLLIEYDKILSAYFLKTGLQKGVEKKFGESIKYMRRALQYDSSNAIIFSNLGGAYYTIQKMDSAKYFWQKTLLLKPTDTDAIGGMRAMGNVIDKR